MAPQKKGIIIIAQKNKNFNSAGMVSPNDYVLLLVRIYAGSKEIFTAEIKGRITCMIKEKPLVKHLVK